MSSPAQPFKGRAPQRGEPAAGVQAGGVPVAAPSTPHPPRTELELQALWRARALRYVLIYVLLACVLVTLRYQSREIYPTLRQLSDTRTELQRQQGELSLTVQSLTSEQRIRAWALSNGMVPYAQASKQTQTFEAPPLHTAALPDKPAPAHLSVRTAWR